MPRQRKPTIEVEFSPPLPDQSLFERVGRYLAANDWNSTAYEDKGYFSTACRTRDANLRVILDVSETAESQRLLVYSFFPVFVPARRRGAMLEAINRINLSLVVGNLEMDLSDGELRMRTTVESSRNLGEDMMERALMVNVTASERYFAPLMAVAFGGVEPSTTLDLVAREDETSLQ